MSRAFQPSSLFLSALFLAACASPAPTGRRAELAASLPSAIPQAGLLQVTGDLRVEPGEYLRPAPSGQGVIVLESLQDVILDLSEVSLRGTPAGSPADRGQGWGVLVRDCERVKILGGSLGGYKIGIRVEDSDGVVIENTHFSPVFGEPLATAGSSTNIELNLESPEQILGQAGAAIAVIGSSRVEIRGVLARGGQNGIMLVRSENCTLEDNDLSYLSGFGIALQGSDHNTVARNRCDAVTRRFQGGRTEADHGATGILLCAGSSDNLLSDNLARGATAGIREWAGNGLANSGNRIVGNDVSNCSHLGLGLFGSEGGWLIDNLIDGGEGCAICVLDSSDVVLSGNRITGTLGLGIQVSSGHRALVQGNHFTDCDTALKFEGSTEALGHWVGQNEFRANIQDLVLENASGLEFWQNDFESAESRVHLDGLTVEAEPELEGTEVWGWLKDAEGHLPSGRSTHSQLLRPTGELPGLLTSIANWSNSRGGQATRPSVPAFDGELEMGAFGPLDPDPSRRPGSATRQVSWLEKVEWEAAWFEWDQDSDPRGAIERWRARRFEPLVRSQQVDWKNPWGGTQTVLKALPDAQYGLIARGNLSIEEDGEYVLSAIADDGVRVMIDGKVALEDWAWHPERRRSEKIELLAGSHPMEVEYFQMDGTAVLSLDLFGPTGP